MRHLLIRGGEVVSATGRARADVLCEGDTIRAVGTALAAPGGCEVLDASDMLVLPGGVDVHTHMELPVGGAVSADDFFTGTAAALAGGTTTIVDFVTPARGESLLAARDRRLAEAAKACADYALHMSVTWWSDEVARELRRVVADGITSFKTYMAYLATIGIDDATLGRVLAAVGDLGGMVTVHAEDGEAVEERRRRLVAEGRTAARWHAESRPPALEAAAVARAIALARRVGHPLYFVHVSTADALTLVDRARRDGLPVHAETCPQYLLLDASAYERPEDEARGFVLSPPLRPRGHQEALWAAVASGLVETVATDHCPFTRADKRLGEHDFTRIPNGAGGVEHRLELLHAHGVARGRIPLERLVDVCCTAPARLFGLHPRKGELQPGSDADVVVLDPRAGGVVGAAPAFSRADVDVFAGLELAGRVHATVARGRVVFSAGELVVERGRGRYLTRRPARA